MNKLSPEYSRLAVTFLLSFLVIYLFPLTIRDTGSAMNCLLIEIPAAVLLIGMWLGIKQGFYWQYALGAALLFIPTVWLYYNISALGYAPAYGVMALVGNLLGSGLRTIRTRRKKL